MDKVLEDLDIDQPADKAAADEEMFDVEPAAVQKQEKRKKDKSEKKDKKRKSTGGDEVEVEDLKEKKKKRKSLDGGEVEGEKKKKRVKA